MFDTETTIDASQRLRVGSYQVRYGSLLWESGLFYDAEAVSASEIAAVRTHANERGYRLVTRAVFVEEVLLHYGWELSGWVIGYNLKFDISRIALAHSKSRTRQASMRGAFSFRLTEDPTKPAIQVKPTGSRSAFHRFAAPAGRSAEARNRDAGGDLGPRNGFFVDVAALAKAITSRTWTLGGLAIELATATRKLDTDHSKGVTPEFLEYAMTDCQVTWECFNLLRERYDSYGLSLTPLWKVFSEASIGKAHLVEMGLGGWRNVDHQFPDRLTAVLLETYYGGRAETRIRRTGVPGVLVDFASQYPTSYVLQDLWRYQIAAEVQWDDESPTEIQALVDRVTVDDVLDSELWTELDRFVLIEPTGNPLITRAAFGWDRTRNVAVTHRLGGPPQWYTLADVLAAKIEGGPSPRVLRAIRFRPGPPQSRLHAIDVAASGELAEPFDSDFVARLVELRRSLTDDRPTHQHTLAHMLKITVNSVSYGIGIEQNVNEYATAQRITVARTDDTEYELRGHRKETPGSWFHPLIATLVAAGGRLLLAAAMRLVDDLGGQYAFCDTDSLFIVATQSGGEVACTGPPTGTITALSWRQVHAITARFEPLNPYRNVTGSILELEAENYDPDTREQREIYCWSIAAKRYALYTVDEAGAPHLIGDKRSEHGLGHLLGPHRSWIDEWWTHLLHLELGFDSPEPDWFNKPAIGRINVGSFHELAAFKTYNRDRPYTEQVRPFGFLCIAHPDPFDASTGGPRCLIAPYETDLDRQLSQPWFDRSSDNGTSWTIRTDRVSEHIEGSAPVSSYRDYFDTYRTHPEAKAADATGRRAGPRSRGLLQPRRLRASKIGRIGKEANRLTDTPELVVDHTDRAIGYPEPATCHQCGKPLAGRQRQWCSEACRKRHQRRAT